VQIKSQQRNRNRNRRAIANEGRIRVTIVPLERGNSRNATDVHYSRMFPCKRHCKALHLHRFASAIRDSSREALRSGRRFKNRARTKDRVRNDSTDSLRRLIFNRTRPAKTSRAIISCRQDLVQCSKRPAARILRQSIPDTRVSIVSTRGGRADK